MEHVDIAVIGAGVVGLAICENLSRSNKEVFLLERYESFGMETSSRNSEVIHAGFYYPKNSLKAELCVEGNRLLYDLCKNFEIPFWKTGKIIIAKTPEEVQNVNHLFEQGIKNHTPGLRFLSKTEISQMEPNISAEFGLFSPETGLIDVHQLMKFYESQSERNGAVIAYHSNVIAIEKITDGYRILIQDTNGEIEEIAAKIVINAAGIGAERIAALAGIDIESSGYQVYLVKGEYFNVAAKHTGKIHHLIYPTPTALSLGIHTRLRLDGTFSLGPSAFYVDEVSYEVNPDHQDKFFESVYSFLPFLKPEDLTPEMSGIRPKLQKPGGEFRDFVIAEESEKGLQGMINLIGIDSPGLTAAPAIAIRVGQLVENILR
ncbi:MAG: NAD(P)/FAD-dependent oxidoreductase [Candidatus Marinimicrobia bacterium CG08_land_8_20_14_0_20_45_22]|nr:MAG: NAD(P)/FAD-dependent oxidoreductase [Candidatus Marinimicrobia bacterium CG08_land_8_20_14_0_20_45_22]